MPTFETPTPIDLAIDLQVGSVEIVASDRADTVVSVTGTHPERAIDRRAAEETRVTFDGARITVLGPRARLTWIGPTESVDVRVDLPTGSRLSADTATGGLRTSGRLGATRVKSATGAVRVEASGDLWLRAMHGNATVGTVDGNAEITTDHGQVRAGTITGDALVKASHGPVTVGEVVGDLEAKLSYGDLEVTRAHGSVTARTAYGAVTLHEVSAGSVQVESGYGEITVGIRAGVAAWLDVSSKGGHVRNQLAVAVAPDPSEETVAVRARTQYGDITVHHAH